LIAQQNWPTRAEKNFALAYLLWNGRAQIALQQRRYKEAAALSARALAVKPDLEEALRVHGQAEYCQADFRRAADSYRQLLKLQPGNPGYVEYYALLLASSDRRTAASEFSQLLEPANNSYEMLDSLVGLQLLSGNTTSADKIYADLKNDPGDSRTPDRLAWLGWWYYIAGNSSRALEMLESATQQRPTNMVYVVNFAWAAIEQRRYEQALRTLSLAKRQLPALNSSGPYTSFRPLTTDEMYSASEILMAEAVANWLARNGDGAIPLYLNAVGTEPFWTNPAWYGPQYSPTVSGAIAEMKAEADRRKKTADIHNRQAQ
jgi:tetratricopeptide (TPR) repeat protein